VSSALTLCLVLLAAYALASLLLSAVVAVACRAGLERALSASGDFLALRLLPSAGAGLFGLTIVMPAFLMNEPPHEFETAGPLLLTLVLFALLMFGDGLRRGRRAWVAAERFLKETGAVGRWSAADGCRVDVLEVQDPIVAVVGGWRPRIVAARRVVAECSPEEFRQVVAHEAAHVSARDNLKRLLLVASPDALAWLPVGAAVAERWRIAAEFEADERATGADPRKRIALAAALVKVARLSAGVVRSRPTLSMTVAVDDVEGRVRQLLAPSPGIRGRTRIKGLAACVLLLPVAAVPSYGLLHRIIEALVAFGG
jgi:Zn-dependent protease with chaperone function